MTSINDQLFIFWILLCFGLILFTPGKISKRSYSHMMAVIFILSCLMITWFHETVIDVSKTSPIHGAILALAQVGTLTLTSKVWLTLNLHQFNPLLRSVLCTIFYGALLVVTVCSYWLYKVFPELQLILYPLASLAISITAEVLEERLK